MKICLKTHTKETSEQKITVTLEERLPHFVNSACQLTCNFQVAQNQDYYLLNLRVTGVLEVICQRCLQVFIHPYENDSKLAICTNESRAEQLMEHFECMVTATHQIDLIDVLTDDLHLFLPEKHADAALCTGEITQWMQINHCVADSLS